MVSGKINGAVYALRLEPGDDIHTAIQDFCAGQNITNAVISGLGSVESPTLAHYSMPAKQFTDRQLAGVFEVTNLTGNIALQNGRPFAHLHVTIAGPDFAALGGHLVKGACSATLELILEAHPTRFRKTPNDAVGLAIWDFEPDIVKSDTFT